jgi:hypothetical protein
LVQYNTDGEQGVNNFESPDAARRPTPRRRPVRFPPTTGSRPSRRKEHVHINPAHRFALFDLGWLCQRLSLKELRVFIVLCSHADRERGNCWPSRDLIAEEAGFGEDVSGVSKALKGLEQRGAIAVDRKAKRPNRYWINPAPSTPAAGAQNTSFPPSRVVDLAARKARNA